MNLRKVFKLGCFLGLLNLVPHDASAQFAAQAGLMEPAVRCAMGMCSSKIRGRVEAYYSDAAGKLHYACISAANVDHTGVQNFDQVQTELHIFLNNLFLQQQQTAADSGLTLHSGPWFDGYGYWIGTPFYIQMVGNFSVGPIGEGACPVDIYGPVPD